MERRTAAHARVHAARAAGLLVALGVLGLCVLLSIAVGAKAIPLSTVWQALWNYDGSYDHSVIFELRLPRTLLGVAVGAALGLSGALMQALTRNPLADPGILGINAGAAAAVVLAVYVFGLTDLNAYVWFAFAGAALTTVVVYVLGSAGRGGATPVRLALAGTAIGAVLIGLVHGVIILNEFVFDQIRFWQIGSLVGRDLGVFTAVLPFLLAGTLLALLLGSQLNAVALGEDLAAALGARVNRTRAVTALAIVLLCGGATAAAGPIAFVGLTVPHVARALIGPDQRWVLPYSAVLAAILLVGADTLGRIVLPTGELEVGIITALVGAPVFIALVRRKKVAKL
ncbi:FecCD family ABC transporter permease [Marinitenerispora sediminis]|uniref:Fe(3+)-siderophore ABC transporter permease n=1 Tax=Marinitenerispora sediminis TaxID=1931232 RepID=A0A368T9B9_9ACTN|nr:iron chelate uptake ABC transporter family permease subunit [Marinitenerispora sediminis]RCV54789.1 Fe(3+)-siderophore ABC transporter permease [Marinitenerispora sediminis]RCV60573.1 Fe(3+)-siderophore ABC transporter permease [Marinitenerispora sediminis]RCV61039.1 Fe(3+)-siderophore ABC transporter permease [Marinitenerispora sediminis]